MTTKEAVYLFDAAVYRMFNLNVVHELAAAQDNPDRQEQILAAYRKADAECCEDLKAAEPFMPKDHPVFTLCGKDISTYYLNFASQLREKFS